jgi:hemerythrin superfamily protein
MSAVHETAGTGLPKPIHRIHPEEEAVSNSAVDLILQDHREFERLFEVLRSQPEKRETSLPVLTTLLTAHSRAEEAEVYPAARDEAGAQHDVAHSQEEHIEADQLLEKLATTDPQSPDFEAALAAVVKSVGHHIEEEEETVLADLTLRLSEQRLIELGDAFLSARAEHLGQQPGEMTKAELVQQAANADLDGSSAMNKDELAEALKDKAAQPD